MGDPTAERIWDATLGQLQIHVTRPNYDTWLKDTKGLRFGDGQFVVGVPTEFVKEWLATRMRSLVSQTVGGIIGQPMDVSFEIIGRNGNGNGNNNGYGDSHNSGNGSGKAAGMALDDGMPLSEGSPAQAIISSPVTRPRLNPRYTFRSFVIADCNRMAAAAAVSAADRPGSDYNPLFVYGSPGLGKTHLLQAVAQRAFETSHNALYITAEQFTNDFVTAIAQGRADEFRRRYRSVRLLLVDDVQFLASKGRTQEEFFYTFNDLHSDGCQLVVASDRAPSAIPGMEGRLCSRFQWGLVADLQPPDSETRLAILKRKAAEQRVDLPVDVARFLADRARENIRELEGSLNRVVAFARLSQVHITLDTAARALAALTPTVAGPADPQVLLQAVSTYFNIAIAALAGKSRAKPIAEARHFAMYLLREDGELALKQVGLLLGHRDHSTVIHGVQKIAKGLLRDPRVGVQLSEVRALASS